MKEPPADSLGTRLSLLYRVRDLDDAQSWQEFFRTYERLVQNMARRRGLREDEVEEVAQEVFRRIAQTIHQFERGAYPGSFRKWLGRLTRWRADDKLRERRRQHVISLSEEDANALADGLPSLPDPLREFEQEARLHLLETLFRRLETRIASKHLQMFQMLVLDEAPVERVAQRYGVSTTSVYLLKHRITRKLRDEVRRLPLRWD